MNASEYWIGELINRSKSTRQCYQHYLSLFCEFVDLSPDELITKRKDDLKEEDIRVQRNMESKLKQFIAHLRDKGYSISTQKSAYTSVRSFFEQNYMPLMMRRGDYPKGDNMGHRALNKDEIRRLVEETSLKNKAIILTLKDCGLRVSDVISLKVGDLEPGLRNGDEFIPIKKITQKKKVIAKTFIGSETIDMIKKYLDHRRIGTRYTPPETITEESPLFRASRKDVSPMSRSSVSSMVLWLTKRVGFNGEVSAHSLRKFFQTRMESTGVSPNWIDQMIGRKLQGVHGSYSQPTEQELLEKYRENYDYLRVYEVKGKSEDIDSLKKQIKELESKLNEITETRKESDQVMNRLFEDPEFQAVLRRKLREMS